MWKFEQQSDRPTLSISSVCTEPSVARRTFLGRSLTGLGTLALGTMLSAAESNTPDILATSRGVVDPRHCEPRAKRVIFLCMAGGPSHLETLDYKPKLAEMHGQPMPESFTQGQPIAQLQGQQLTCLAPQHRFARYGKSEQLISTAFRHLPRIADEMCIVRSLKTEQINHDPAHTFMNTGTAISGRPSMGAWVLYGLGRRHRSTSRVRCSHVERGRAGSTHRGAAVAQRIPAQPVSGRPVSLGRRSGTLRWASTRRQLARPAIDR